MILTFLTSLLLYHLPISSASHNTPSLSYNGGKIMTEPVTVSLLWFGTGWQESGREAIRNAVTSLSPSRYPPKDSDVPTLGDWWDIVRQYKDSSSSPVTDELHVGPECFYTGPELNVTLQRVIEIGKSVFNKTSIDQLGSNLTCTRVFVNSTSTIHYVLFSHTVMFLFGEEQMELIDTCGGKFLSPVDLLWARAPVDPYDHCGLRGSYYSGAPNGDGKADSVVGFMLAGMAEQVTNSDGRGWVSNGLTVKSSCESPFGKDKDGPPLFIDSQRNVSFNAVGLNGYRYILSYIWDQRINNCALKLSGTCEANEVIVEKPKGYLSAGIVVNHTNGLQPFSPNQRCQWKLSYPGAKFISLTINYLSIPSDSDDHLRICHSDSTHCSDVKPEDALINKNFKLTSSKAYVQFISGDHVSFESRGWELSYSAGFCDGKKDVYDRDGTVSYISSTGFSYTKGLSCQWVFHGKPGTLVSLNFTHINVSQGLDFLAIFDAKMQQIANFSGLYSDSDLPRVNVTGELRIAFATQTDQGEGWSARFYISSPVEREKRALLFIIIVLVSVIGASFSLTLIALALLRGRRKRASSMVKREGDQIGEGPSAVVYQGFLGDGSLVAVKRFKDSMPMSRKDLEEEILSKSSSHPNIVSLAGRARGKRCLVLEFLSQGSLSQVLMERGETLDWGKRLDIALQVSSAIQFLHMYLKPLVHHGNVSSHNILLDEAHNAKLAGFGKSNYCRNEGANPEHLMEMAEDIWGLGLVLVELLRGESLGDTSAWKSFQSLEEINEFVGGLRKLDHRMEIPKEKCKVMALAKMGDIARWCISSSLSVERVVNKPKIGDVLAGLKQVKIMYHQNRHF